MITIAGELGLTVTPGASPGVETRAATPVLFIVVPCFNEEAVLPDTIAQLRAKMAGLVERHLVAPASRVLLIDNGSRDGTWRLIGEAHAADPVVSGLQIAANHGFQNGIVTGLMYARKLADIAISIDADLQDDIDAIDAMVEAYGRGFDVVYGVRSSRRSDSLPKRATAGLFYHLMTWLGAGTVHNAGDFRLLSARALDALAEYDEVNLFLRGLVPLIGLPSTTVEYARKRRTAGHSKFSPAKLVSFALDGITSFSIRPIRVISALAILMFIGSLGMAIWFIVQRLLGDVVPGWASTVTSIWALGSFQLLAIGVVGEYVAKTYMESKRRPRVFVTGFIHTPPENPA